MSLSGFYRGIVKNNDDSRQPLPNRGCVQVFVPQVYGDRLKLEELPWAEPCFPFGGGRVDGRGSYGMVAIPPIDSEVWVGFEQGDPQHPIWFGSPVSARTSPEIPPQAIYAGNTKRYPDILIIKAPPAPGHRAEDLVDADEKLAADVDGLYLRFVGSDQIELVFNQGQNQLVFDNVRKELSIKTTGWNLNLNANCLVEGEEVLAEGNINISANAVQESGGKITISGREITLAASGQINVQSSGELQLVGADRAVLASNYEIHGMAPVAHGFEDH